jgi:hypothetical protein
MRARPCEHAHMPHHCIFGRRSDRRWMRWWAYVAAQTALVERRQRAINNRQQTNWSWERHSDEIAALEHACHRAIVLIRRWTAGHVGLIGNRHFDGLCRSGSASGGRKQSNGNGNQSGQYRASKSHGWTIWRYGLRVNGIRGGIGVIV